MTQNRTTATSKKPKSLKAEALPKQFRGARVVHGLGMKPDAFDTLVSRHAYGEFSDADGDTTYLVVEDKALQDDCFMRLFASEAHAIRYARALSNGNVDHRVLRVTAQTLVIGTDNKL